MQQTLQMSGGQEVVVLNGSTSPKLDMGWRTDFSDVYSIRGIVGAGSFGKVYSARHIASGQEVAVKTIPKNREKQSRSVTLEKISREVSCLQLAQSCPGVVQLIDCFEDEDNVHLVTELCGGGDLKRYVEAHGALDEAALALVAAQILQTIKLCHTVDILYSDVKPANFCLTDLRAFREKRRVPNLLKAVDFGCSQHFQGPNRRSSKRSGTLGFLAPEVFAQNYSHKAEVWSIGVTLYWLYTLRLPFWRNDQVPKSPTLEQVTNAVTWNHIPFNYGPWLKMSPKGLDFMAKCLTRPENKRLSVDEALDHPWLAGVADPKQLLVVQRPPAVWGQASA